MKFKFTRSLIGALCLSLITAAAVFTKDEDDAAKQASKAAKVFTEIMAAPDKAIPNTVLDKSQCIAVFPQVIKAGFVIGYFMHLKYDVRFHSFVFFSTVLFVGIFFALTFFDLRTRDMMNTTWDSHQYARDAGLLERPPIKDPKPMTEEERAKAEAEEHH